MKYLNKKRFSRLSAAVVAIITVFALLLSACGSSKKKDSTAELFSGTPQELFVHVEGNALHNCVNSIASSFSTSAGNTGAEVEIRLKPGQFLLSMAESALGMGDLDFLKDIFMRYQIFTQGELMSLAAEIGLGQQRIASLDSIIDGDGTTYLRCPELLSDYLKMADPTVKMTTTDEGERVAVAASASRPDMTAILEALPSADKIQKLANTLIDTALNQVVNVMQTTETVTVGDVSQEQTVLTATISEADITNMGIAILEKFKNDDTLWEVLEEIAVLAGESDFDPAEMQAGFNEAIAELTASLEYCNSENYMLFKTYLNNAQQIMGRSISIYSAGETPLKLIDYRSAESKGTTALTLTFGNVIFNADLRLEGSKTQSAGNYTLTFNGTQLATIQLSNLSENSGTLRLVPAKALLDLLMDGADMPISMLGEIALVLDYATKGDSTELGLQLELNNEPLLGVTLKGKPISGGKITVPTQFLDMNKTEDELKFSQQMDLTAIMENLVKAGVPESLVADLLR